MCSHSPKEMRGLFNIILVNYQTEVIWERRIVADNAEKGKIIAILQWHETYPKGDIDDWDIICNRLGDVRKEREVQEVRIVGK